MPLYVFDNSVPATNDNPSDDQPDMLVNNQSTNDIIGTDHITFNMNNGGQHKAITFNQDASYAPVSFPVSPPQLFTSIGAGGIPQLVYYSGTAAQSSNQYTLAPNGSTFLMAGFIIKWGVATVPAGLTGPITFASLGLANFPNNCYNVTANVHTSSVTPSTKTLTVQTRNFTVSQFTIDLSATNITTINFLAIGN